MKTFIYVKATSKDYIKEVGDKNLNLVASGMLKTALRKDKTFKYLDMKTLTDEEEIFVTNIESLILDFYEDVYWSDKQVTNFIHFISFFTEETKDFLSKVFNNYQLESQNDIFIENICKFIGMDKKYFVPNMYDFCDKYINEVGELLD